jgi:hypothetical protein
MKKFIFAIVFVVGALIIIGAFWNLNVQKEHAFENYQKELAKREKRIIELEDSIAYYRNLIVRD